MCRPMQKMMLHGLSTQWNYDDCMKNVQAANATSIYEKTTDGTTHFDYKWTDGGMVSYFSASRTDPVTSPTYELEGHTCVVSTPDSKYGLRMSYDGCIGAVKPPDATTVQEYSTKSHIGYYYNWTTTASEDYPLWELGSPTESETATVQGSSCWPTKEDSDWKLYFENEQKCLDAFVPLTSSNWGKGDRMYDPAVLQSMKPPYYCWCMWRYVKFDVSTQHPMRNQAAGNPPTYATTTCAALSADMATLGFNGCETTTKVGSSPITFQSAASTTPETCENICTKAFDVQDFVQQNYNCDDFKESKDAPFKCTKIKPSTNPKTKDEAIAWFKTNKPATSICEYYKADASGPYLCTPTPSGAFPTTKDEAIAYYKKNYNADAICAPLKDNAPFKCTGTEQKSYFEIVSLSYSNAEMVFGLLGSFIVLVLYKCKRAKDPDALDEDALMKRLDALEADNKELKADNKELKAEVSEIISKQIEI